MCNIKYILCTIFCMCAYLHAAAICSDSISDKFSYKVLENFNYCCDNNNNTNHIAVYCWDNKSGGFHKIYSYVC